MTMGPKRLVRRGFMAVEALFNRAFGGCIGTIFWQHQACYRTGYIDDPAIISKTYGSFAQCVKYTFQVNVDHPVKLFVGEFGDLFKNQHPGIVDQNVNSSELLDCGIKQSRDVGRFADIRLNCDTFSACLRNSHTDIVRSFVVLNIIDYDFGASFGQRLRDFSTDPARGAGNNGDFFMKGWHVDSVCLRFIY